MKYMIAILTFVAVSALGAGSQPVARRAPPVPARAPAGTPEAAGQPQRPLTATQYADRLEETSFRGCDRNSSVLEGTDNPGGAAGSSARPAGAGVAR